MSSGGPPEPDDPRPRIDSYHLLDTVGAGTSGVVYRARHRDSGRLVACDTPAALKDRWQIQPAAAETRVRGAEALEAAFLAIIGRRGWASV